MNRAPAIYLTAMPALLALAGCATPATEFPSLAIRDSERVSGTIAVPAPQPVIAPAPAALAQLDQIIARVREGHQAFTAGTAAARGSVAAARGAASGSDTWSAAQIAVANLESHRSQVMIALADLDRRYVDAAVDGADVTRLTAAQAEANGLTAQENAEIDRLLGALAS